MQGFLAPVAASVSLFGLYLLIKFFPDLSLQTFIDGYFFLLGSFALSSGATCLLQVLTPPPPQTPGCCVARWLQAAHVGAWLWLVHICGWPVPVLRPGRPREELIVYSTPNLPPAFLHAYRATGTEINIVQNARLLPCVSVSALYLTARLPDLPIPAGQHTRAVYCCHRCRL